MNVVLLLFVSHHFQLPRNEDVGLDWKGTVLTLVRFGGILGEYFQAVVRILTSRSRAKITMGRSI